MNNDSDNAQNGQAQPRPVANADVLPVSSQTPQVQQPPQPSEPKDPQVNPPNQEQKNDKQNKLQENKPKNNKPKLPALAITIAVIISACLIGLAIYIQLSSEGKTNINDFVN